MWRYFDADSDPSPKWANGSKRKSNILTETGKNRIPTKKAPGIDYDKTPSQYTSLEENDLKGSKRSKYMA